MSSSISGAERRTQRRTSPRLTGLDSRAGTISTFSCDIAYSDSPAASRASSRSAYALASHGRSVPERATARRLRMSISTPLRLALASHADDGDHLVPLRRWPPRARRFIAEHLDQILQETRNAPRRPAYSGRRDRVRRASDSTSRSMSSSPVAKSRVRREPHRCGARPPRSPATSPTPRARRLRGLRRGRDSAGFEPRAQPPASKTVEVLELDRHRRFPCRSPIAWRRTKTRPLAAIDQLHSSAIENRSKSSRPPLHELGETLASSIAPPFGKFRDNDQLMVSATRPVAKPPAKSPRSRPPGTHRLRGGRSPRSPATSPTPTARRLRGPARALRRSPLGVINPSSTV